MIRYFERAGGVRLAYTDQGKGDTIVLIHGYLESLLVFERLAGMLGQRFRVVCVDLPGHGLSDPISECHTMEQLADSVRSLLLFLGIGEALITGHSLGGYVTLAFLERYPEMVKGYCLFHSHPFADTPEASERRLREIEIVKAGKKSVMYPANISRMFAPQNLDRMKEELEFSNSIASHTPDEGIIAVLKGMIERKPRVSLMEEGVAPLLWILGLHDQYIDYSKVSMAVNLPSNARLVTLNESGHLGFIEEPEKSANLLTEFAIMLFGADSRA